MSDTGNSSDSCVTLLYVEDDPATSEQVSRILNARGYQLIKSENGQLGLEAFLEHRPDMVLTDIMMPRMNGLEMARQIRQIDPEVQIVCMTAFSETSYLIEAIDIGINQFVPKPIEFSRLLAALKRCREILDLKKRHRKLEAEIQKTKKLESIGILAAGMAHDFNNLLQVILGYVSLARMSCEKGSKAAEMLTIAERTSENARQLGKRLMTLAKGGEACMISTDLAPLIVAGLEVEKAPAGFSLITDFPDNLPKVQIDPTQIRHVVSQLASNAFEAMPGGGTLRITASQCLLEAANEQALEPGEYLHVVFRDSGCGIRPEILPSIFDPYFSTKEMGSQKGTGLGLAICHSIIRHHRGQIQAESEPGRGTAIHIYLPLSRPAS